MRKSQKGSSHWMVDVGVALADVNYLQRIAASPQQRVRANTSSRVRRIQQRAYEGLLATIRVPASRAAMSM